MAASKRMRPEDVFKVYKNSYNIKISWREVFDNDIDEFLTVYERANNCSKTLVTASLLSLVSSLCGPNSKVFASEEGYSSVLNQYLIAICAPGGGKSNTYYKIIDPVLSEIRQKHGINIHLENYTTAGLQKHQVDTSGYGIITGDEGHRFLQSITTKQSHGEGERSLLCKMWGGKGDHCNLVTGTRGFDTTSMSVCLFIQPQPLLSELCNLGGDDGLIDRFLFLSARPVFNHTAVTKENLELLKEQPLQSFVGVMTSIFEEHRKGQHYKLSREAEQIYDSLIDSYSDLINSKYGSDQDDDKENEVPFADSQQDSFTNCTTTKDTTNILRLAAVLHILQHNLTCSLKNIQLPTPKEVPAKRMKQAMTLYNALLQQKSQFTQALQSYEKESLKLKVVTTLRERVTKIVCKTPGPFVTAREIQKRIKNSISQNVKIELEYLAKKGFGTMKTVESRNGNRFIFFKLPGQCIDEEIGQHITILKSIDINLDTYSTNFDDTSAFTEQMKAIVIHHHPQADMIESVW